MSALRETGATAQGYNLAAIAGTLRDLRSASQKRRYRGAPPPLPSREIVTEAVDALVSALFPRHFGPPDLAAEEADAFVIRTLEAALPALRRQIELELALVREWKGEDRIDSPKRADDIVSEFARSLPRARALLDTDVRAAFDGDRQPEASTRSSSASPASPPSFATGWRMSSTGQA